MNYWILAIIEEGFLRHLSVWADDLMAKERCVEILAPKFGFKPGGDPAKDWSALEDHRENFEDDGDYEFYLELVSLPFPEGRHPAVLIDEM